MKKYFNKKEAELILNLLHSDKENIKFGLNLIKTHPKYKNFKKLITYRNKVWNPGNLYQGVKVNLEHEIIFLNNQLCKIMDSFRPYDYLIKFIKKRTRHE